MWTAPRRSESRVSLVAKDDQAVPLLVGGHPSLELILVPRRSGQAFLEGAGQGSRDGLAVEEHRAPPVGEMTPRGSLHLLEQTLFLHAATM
jgi:hypothetical protein